MALSPFHGPLWVRRIFLLCTALGTRETDTETDDRPNQRPGQPVIRVPLPRWLSPPFTFTIGRCLGSIAAGYLLCALTRSRRLLAAHSALSFACCCLVRVLVRPVPGRPAAAADAPAPPTAPAAARARSSLTASS